MRIIDVDELKERLGIADKCDNCSDKMKSYCDGNPSFALTCELICNAPTVDAVRVVRCKECKHRPKYDGPNRVVFPDEVCPCQCDDLYYNWMPSDDWFCADGERKE